jgi:hypothetical protein
MNKMNKKYCKKLKRLLRKIYPKEKWRAQAKFHFYKNMIALIYLSSIITKIIYIILDFKLLNFQLKNTDHFTINSNIMRSDSKNDYGNIK